MPGGMDRNHVVLVTGGARSGKSRFSEQRVAALAPDGPWLYLATAEALDDEMRERIARHRAARPGSFRTVEAPRDPAAAMAREAARARAVLLDCVTLWLSNRLLAGDRDDQVLAAVDGLADAARAAPVPVVLVTNEVGAGVVPESALGRRFRDLQGIANQRLAERADEVVLMACGLPLRLR